jgi:REP element-mobilizing transposase RayT
MSQSLVKNILHITFSTQHRRPLITNELKKDLIPYLSGIARDLKSPVYVVNLMADHVHLLLNLDKTVALSKLVQEIKQGSSRWINEQGKLQEHFHWQKGYGAFSVSKSGLDQVVKYINEQEKHHKKISFQDELRALLRRYEIEYDENYLWD